jgi:hypothetical protein
LAKNPILGASDQQQLGRSQPSLVNRRRAINNNNSRAVPRLPLCFPSGAQAAEV